METVTQSHMMVQDNHQQLAIEMPLWSWLLEDWVPAFWTSLSVFTFVLWSGLYYGIFLGIVDYLE